MLHPTDSVISGQDGTGHRIYDVVDGQQRLTTLILLLEALRRKSTGALAHGVENRYLWIMDVAGQRQPKLRFTDGSQEFFERSVLAAVPAPGPPQTRAQARLSEALAFYEERLAVTLADASDEASSLRDLHDRLAQHFRVSVLEVKDESEVGLIFEVLNSRGRPLSELDLVKNYILYIGTKLEFRHDLHEDVALAWARILTELMSAGVGSSADENQLLRAHWLMAYDYQKQHWDRSRSIKEHFRLRGYPNHRKLLKALANYVSGLSDAAVAYADIYSPTRSEAFGELQDDAKGQRALVRVSERLIRTRAIAVFVPLLVATRLTAAGDASAYLAMVEIAERYAFRVYRLLGKRADAGESAICAIAYDLFQDKVDMREARDRFTALLLYHCSDQDFEAEFADDVELNDWYHWSGIKYLLYEYEQHLVGADPVRIPWEVVERLDREKTIEHVLPQTPKARYWTHRFKQRVRERYTHDLGNLVLTADNSSYGNKPFPDKKGTPGLATPCYANSNLKSERELARYDDWTVDTLRDRRERIVAWALKRWAVTPTASSATVVAVPQLIEDEDSGDVTA